MRRSHMRRFVAVACTVSALVVGCTNDGPEDTPDPTPPATADDEDDPDSAAPDAVDGDDEQDGDDLAGRASGTIEFRGLQQVHPQFALAGITAVTVDDAGNIIVDLEAYNRLTGLSLRLFSDGVLLEDDLGNAYPPVAPEAGSLSATAIPPEHRAEMSLVFEGPVDPDATQVSLGLNSREGFLGVDVPTTYGRPTFAFLDVPLPGVGSADQGAGPGGGRLLLAPVTLELDDQVVVSDPLGVALELRSVTVGPLSIEVEVHARNESDGVAALTEGSAALLVERDGEVLDDHEFAYLRNERTETGGERGIRMTMQPGEEVEGRLVFRGGVPPDADAFRIGFNQTNPERLRSGEPEPDTGAQVRSLLLGVPLPDLPTYGDDDDA